MPIYTYIKDDYNFIQLLDEVYSAITKQLYAVNEGDVLDGYAESNGSQINFVLNVSLSGSEESILSATVASHIANPDYMNEAMSDSDTTLLTGLTDQYENDKTYIGFGSQNACKILRVISTGTTYESLWADGNQILNKVWSARTGYSYY